MRQIWSAFGVTLSADDWFVFSIVGLLLSDLTFGVVFNLTLKYVLQIWFTLETNWGHSNARRWHTSWRHRYCTITALALSFL